MNTYYGTIAIIGSLSMGYMSDEYAVSNVKGSQYCFNSNISTFTRFIKLPISLFNGKKEGDEVTLYFKPNYYDAKEFMIIVTCEQLKSAYKIPFEQALYHLSYNINGGILLHWSTLYLAYHGHVDYAKSVNLSAKYYWKTYQPILFINYIHMGCNDINYLLKNVYIDLFIKEKPNIIMI